MTPKLFCLLYWRRLLILPVFALVLAGCMVSSGRQGAPRSLVQVQVLSEGPHMPAVLNGPVITWSERLTEPRQNVVYFLKIDLTDPRVEVFVQLSDEPKGLTGPAEGILTLPDELMVKRTETLALMNANAFSPVPSITDPPNQRGWYPGRPVHIEGLAVGDRVLRSPDDSKRMAFWLDADGRPHIGHSASSNTVRQGVADWISPLLINGRNMGHMDPKAMNALPDEMDSKEGKINASVHPRSLLGFDDTGRWLLLAVVDGRQKGYSLGLTLSEEAELMRAKGCTQAINLDGGGSSILLVRDATGTILTCNRPSDGKPRPVPVMIGVRRTSYRP